MNKFILLVLGLVLSVSTVFADQWNKKTYISLNQSFIVPGAHMRGDIQAFSPGRYVFKLMDSQSNRNIVQIYNEDETRLIATVLAIPAYRQEVTGRTTLLFKRTERGLALYRWFYPGENYGWEFPLKNLGLDQGSTDQGKGKLDQGEKPLPVPEPVPAPEQGQNPDQGQDQGQMPAPVVDQGQQDQGQDQVAPAPVVDQGQQDQQQGDQGQQDQGQNGQGAIIVVE